MQSVHMYGAVMAVPMAFGDELKGCAPADAPPGSFDAMDNERVVTALRDLSVGAAPALALALSDD